MASRLARPGGLDPYSFPHSSMTTAASPPPSTVAEGLVRGDLKTPWRAWREGGEPRVIVDRHRHTTAPPASFDDANDLTQKGWTPAPDQLPEKKQDRLEVILSQSGVLDDTPDPPSIQRPAGRRVRTKSGLITSKDTSRATRVTVDDGKTKTHGKLSSHSTEAQAMPSKPLAGAGASGKPVAKTGRTEKPTHDGTPIVDLTADPAPSKSKKRKSPQASDTDSGRTRHKKQRVEIDPPAQNVEPAVTNHQAPLELVAASEVPPSGQHLVEEPSTENRPVQAEDQSHTLSEIIEEPETMDMDQGFEFESPGKYLAEANQQPMGMWTANPNTMAKASAAKLPTKGQQKRVNFDVSKGQINDVEYISRGDSGTATVGPEATIPRSPSPLFVRPRTATPVHRKQGRHSLNTPRGSSEMELVTSNTTADSVTSRISETPHKLTGQRNLLGRPPSPTKITKRRPQFLPPKKHTPVSSSDTFVEGTCTQPEGFRDPNPVPAEDQWREATGDESLPVVLHSVITALHRTLKSKEDAIGDVARQYRENALELLDAMESRHKSDRIESRNAHELASHGILRAFSLAETDMKGLVSSIRALEVHRVMTSVRHPEFREKLERVFRLYEARLGKSAENTPGEEVAGEEPGEARPQQGNKCDEDLINDYCAALRSKTQQNDEATSAMLRKVHAEADRLLYGIPQEAGQEQRPAPVEVQLKKVEDVVIQGLSFELDEFIDRLGTGRCRKAAIAGAVLGVISESRNSEDPEDPDWE